jgi:hypothetical protein
MRGGGKSLRWSTTNRSLLWSYGFVPRWTRATEYEAEQQLRPTWGLIKRRAVGTARLVFKNT